MTVPVGACRSALRRVWLYSSERNDVKASARVARGKYKCAACKKLFAGNRVQVDHVDPVGKFVDWNTFIERLFCSPENLQVLCIDCHKRKTTS